MPKSFNLQSNLNRGELDAKLIGRADIDSYYSGLKEAENVVCLPQGGVQRRQGTVYIGALDANARLERFSFNNAIEYLLVFYPLRMYVYKQGVLQTNISGSGDNYLTTTITADMLNEFDYTQSADTVIICHPDLETKIIGRTSDTAWSYASISYSNIPQYNFDDSSSPTPTNEVQSLVFAHASNGDRYKLSVDDFLTEEIIYSSDTATNESRIESALHALVNTGNQGIAVSYASGSTYAVVFGGDSAGPYGLITGFAILTQNSSFSAESTRTTAGVSKAENVWSATRGYPASSTFHANRLFLGGSKSLPTTMWGSVIGAYYNFNLGKGRDHEAIEVFLDTDQLNAIRHLISNKKLQILTTGQHFYVPDDVIKPGLTVRSISNEGSGLATPVVLDEDILYANRTGKRLNTVTISNQYQPTTTRNVAMLAPHLVDSPVKLAASKGTSSEDANFVYIVNSSGTMSVLNTLESEGVEGFSRWSTDGLVKSAAIVDDDLYLVVHRSGKGSSGDYFIEKADSEVFFDCAVKGSGTSVDMSHFSGDVTVSAKGDGYSLGNGSSFPVSYTALQAGLSFTASITTLPINMEIPGIGSTVSLKKRLRRCFLRLYQTAGVSINGNRISDRFMNDTAFSPPSLFTGQKEIPLFGYSRDALITISQDLPFNMTILSINAEVKL